MGIVGERGAFGTSPAIPGSPIYNTPMFGTPPLGVIGVPAPGITGITPITPLTPMTPAIPSTTIPPMPLGGVIYPSYMGTPAGQ
jgi:hypothetical protein